jgi:Kef-type K+ transport system membrane component KefB
MEILPLELTVLLFAAMLGIVLAKRFGQSAIVGEILIGVLIGPTFIGLITYNEPVKILAELGAIFMLFTVGLESEMKHIYKLKNFFVAVGGVVVPFVAGWYVAKLFGYTGVEGLFIGTALTATSIAITARILQERGLLHSEVAKTIIGAAVVDDILGLIVLSVITSMSTGFDAGVVGIKILVAILFVAGAVLMVKPVNKLIDWVEKVFSKHSEHVPLFAALVIAFGYAAVAQLIGLSSIIGAFLAGVTLKTFDNKALHSSVYSFELLFSAIFFVSIGVVVDFTQLGSVWTFAIALIVVAVLSKLVGCFLIAKAAGHNAKESLSVGLGMVPRGEVAMIVGLIGLSAGIVSQAAYGAIILMAFVTTIITPIFLQQSLEKHNTKS